MKIPKLKTKAERTAYCEAEKKTIQKRKKKKERKKEEKTKCFVFEGNPKAASDKWGKCLI